MVDRREVRDFIEHSLGPEGLARSVVIVATSDQPALVRIKAAFTATTIAEHRRLWGREGVSFDPVHYLALLERKPGALDHARPLAGGQLPDCFATLGARILRGRAISR